MLEVDEVVVSAKEDIRIGKGIVETSAKGGLVGADAICANGSLDRLRIRQRLSGLEPENSKNNAP